jgi:hypothetical protein
VPPSRRSTARATRATRRQGRDAASDHTAREAHLRLHGGPATRVEDPARVHAIDRRRGHGAKGVQDVIEGRRRAHEITARESAHDSLPPDARQIFDRRLAVDAGEHEAGQQRGAARFERAQAPTARARDSLDERSAHRAIRRAARGCSADLSTR